jgi:predicted small lipoprotein YifL
MRTLTSLALVVAVAALTGCGDGKTGPTAPTGDQTAGDVAEMLKEFTAATKRGPNSAADMTDAPASHPVGHAAVASGEYVVVWKVPVSASGGGTVLAYPKNAGSAGGAVVMLDGSVKVMTAEEFNAAPKAKK